MRTLYLHIGAPKTGSTYIQSSLRSSRQALAREGLIYPPVSEAAGIGQQSWTEGNGAGLFDSGKSTRSLVGSAMTEEMRGMVFSSETLLNSMMRDECRQALQETLERFHFKKARILVFLRDPIGSAVSMWLQIVKKNGCVDDLSTFLTDSGYIQGYMESTARTLESLSSMDGIELVALNYSKCKADILRPVGRWLETDHARLVVPDARNINRSLDAGEARLQLELNRILGSSAHLLGKALTERITDMRPWKPPPPIEMQESIWREVEPWVGRINRFLPTEERLVFDRMEPSRQGEDFKFSEEQLRVIAETMGGEIKRYWDSETSMMRSLRNLFSRLHVKR